MPRTTLRSLFALLASLLAGCATQPSPATPAAGADPTESSVMDRTAETYVKLVLAVGQHDPDYVDAYYGPPAWRTEAEAAKRPLAEIGAEAARLIAELEAHPPDPSAEELVQLRHRFLGRQLHALAARVEQLAGKRLAFDEESRALYDAVAPAHPASYFEGLGARLDSLLPGEGPIPPRLAQFRKQFVIPPDRLDAVFRAAIAECRRRTREHVELPPGESFEIEYVTKKPWSAYNWYKGNFHSLIQVNSGLPILADRAIDLACHEGYPGHHVYNVLLEKHLVRDRGWIELAVYPLFSPQSLIAEGTANFGIDVAFPGAERVAFERDVLYPLAGIDGSEAERYSEVQRLVLQMDYAANEAARDYLNGEKNAEQAADFLVRYALMKPERATQRIKFFDKYRSYVINYNLGRDLVRAYIESRGGTPDDPERRWEEFEKLLSSPRLPSGLR